MAGSFDLRKHTADVAVEATGERLGDAFAAVANGLAAAMCDSWPGAEDPSAGERRGFAVTAEGREAALFDYLDQLIYERDVQRVLPVDNEAAVSEDAGRWQVEAAYRAVPLAAVAARDVKAVTYSEMTVAETSSGWEVYVVFDV